MEGPIWPKPCCEHPQSLCIFLCLAGKVKGDICRNVGMESLRGAPRGNWVGCWMAGGLGRGLVRMDEVLLPFPGISVDAFPGRSVNAPLGFLHHQLRGGTKRSACRAACWPLGGKTGLLRCALLGSICVCASLHPVKSPQCSRRCSHPLLSPRSCRRLSAPFTSRPRALRP